jgi:hypothetical protein
MNENTESPESLPSPVLRRGLARSGPQPDGSTRVYLGSTRRVLLTIMAVLMVSTTINLIALPIVKSPVMWLAVGVDVVVLVVLGRRAAPWSAFAIVSDVAVTFQKRWPQRAIALADLTSLRYKEFHWLRFRGASQFTPTTRYWVDLNEIAGTTRFDFKHAAEAQLLVGAIHGHRPDLELVGMPELDEAEVASTTEPAVAHPPGASSVEAETDTTIALPVSEIAAVTTALQPVTVANGASYFRVSKSVLGDIFGVILVLIAGYLGLFVLLADRRPVARLFERSLLLRDIQHGTSLFGEGITAGGGVDVSVSPCNPKESWLRASSDASKISVSLSRPFTRDPGDVGSFSERGTRWIKEIDGRLGKTNWFTGVFPSYIIDQGSRDDRFKVVVSTRCVVANSEQRKEIVAAMTDLGQRVIAVEPGLS